ncbi:MAG TPA: UDP-3-O-acyl-N-acetylglucosamine deacetylase [Syntrophorhabdaceae bacterium]|nr:UDP-3-O-acyl-N-acetylglucosamine deacetylase [Syntrophorhabdaceae bacterium]HON84431.1 UDP-3-O-acyl-N-acetylglucosamine deacetylase [Syntrophorhabdaceae bacterium]HOT41170.1 UDP-3-O-acyl-N-acetylglucosamine deacetylase [Syntrophorhabdaceae bacterium]HPC65767.1 UDP-3-O-acyl-N-acetylglucosamine deacetylase [Syntrophorhabdaceae bacterium]HPP41656.1 UDP-3-O-acyl-N-acetylglucosamine deacetylase [Syntrophorhabdaceae bacterium]
MAMKKLLIIDDEKNILDILSSMLEDEGFIVFKATDGKMGLSIFEKERPDIVFLDIWMPEMDGIQILREIKKRDNDPVVIVISGHGTISTAVEAVKMGAFDFLEKPLTIEKVLEVISRGLAGKEPQQDKKDDFRIGISKGPNICKQKTIGKSIVVYGVGLHSGVKTGMILLPMPEDTGIVFEHVPEGERIPAFIDYVYSIGYASSVKGKTCIVRTIEHLMATCHMYGITNLLIKVSEEVPILDGSAIELCKKIEEAEIVEQKEGVEPLKINEVISLKNLPDDKHLYIEPAEHFEVIYDLVHPEPIGIQHYHFIDEKNAFRTDIAPARTFGFLKDFERLNQMGLGSGGRVNNVILLSDTGVVNTKLRYKDEFVRHKVLDLIGDLYLLNRPIIGRVVAKQTGHMENIGLVKELKSHFYH